MFLSDNQSKILRYPNPTGLLSTYREGQMLGEIWGYETIGIAKTQEEMDNHLATLPKGGQTSLGSRWEAGDIMYRDINGDEKIDDGTNTIDNHGDLKIIGNSHPRYNFSFDINAGWKGFDFRAFFQGVLKRDYFQNSYYFWGAERNVWWSNALVENLDYFRSDPEHPLGVNLDSYYPRPLFGWGKNKETQTRYLQNASYLRLKNLQIGYTLPKSFTEKIFIENFRIFLSGENLCTGTKMITIFDPETIEGGFGGNVYPLTKTYAIGVSLNF